mmetsp:Transcript_126476/g.369530  ORF Transcript_126476/g.369530 Transcript_126476/m.369530 type:complete len:451 (-) Transcript_126476:376-1728(-)
MGNTGSLNEESFHAHYTLGKQLGKGAQGRVHACLHNVTGGSFAVKLIDRSVKTSWTTYRREVELCKSACSHNVVGVLADFVDNDHCYIVMERFEGHLRKGLKWVAKEAAGRPAAGLSDDALRCLMRQVLKGVQHLHACDIVHRDVKSHNVFIDRLDVTDPRCRVVVGDLGLARRLEQGRFLCAQVGTRKYWAPELYDKKYSHNVDVFACGVLLFLMVCSQYPYFDEQQTRHRDVFAEGLLPSGLSPCTSGFLRLLLQKDPARRPSAAGLAAEPWLLGASAGPEAGQPLPPQVCRRWQSCQIPKVHGDANEELEEDSTGAEGGPQDDWEAESTTIRCEGRRSAPPGACDERTPSTPTTTALDMSIAAVSPSTRSAGPESERQTSTPGTDQLEQDTVEEAHSESATPRPGERAAAGGPDGDPPDGCAAVAEQAGNCRASRREPGVLPEIESL